MTRTLGKKRQVSTHRGSDDCFAGPGRCHILRGLLLATAGTLVVLGSWTPACGLGPIDPHTHHGQEPPASTDMQAAGKAATEDSTVAPADDSRRSKAEIEELINKAGRTPPEWWDSVDLTYPPTLDLVGKRKVEGWKPNIKLVAYMVSRVSPNPRRWRGGIKLLHHVLPIRKDDPNGLRAVMHQLAWTYFSFEQDYARAAFWLRKVADYGSPYADNLIRQATCYWHLGNRQMAEQILRRFRQDRTRFGSLIRLRAKMGDFDKAIALAEARSSSTWPAPAYLAAGDISRAEGKFEQAADYYRRILALKKGSRDLKNFRRRAQDNLRSVEAFMALDFSRMPDGTYGSSSPAYRGPVTVAVKIKSGRIKSVEVVRHKEDMAFTSIEEIPKRIVLKQGIHVDAITGATVTSEAILNATTKALTKAMR